LVFDDSHYRFDQEKATPKPTEAPLMFKAQGALMPFDDLFFRASGARLAYVYEQCGVGQCGTVNVYGEKAQFRQEGETPARSLVISGELKKTSGNETVPCSPPPKEGTPTPTPTPEVPLIYQLDATTLRVEVVDAPPKSQLLSNMGSLAFRLNYRPGTSLLDRLNLVTLLNPGVVLVECDEEDDPSDKSVPLRGGLYFLPKARFGLVLPFNPLLANFTIQPIEAKDLGPVVYDPIEAVRNDLVDRAIVAHFDQSVFDPYRYPTVLKDDDLRVIAQRDDLRSKFTHVTLPKWFEVGRVGEQPGNLDVGRAVLDKETADNTFLITNQVLETLTATGANSKVEPQLASVTPADPTHLSWHVRLAQENVRFHDGTSLDAEALRFNFDRWQEAGLLDIAKVELVADNELVVTLNQADRGFAARLAQPQFGVHSPMAVQRYRSAYGSPEVGVVGTGPFRFKSRDPASRSAQIVLERNENYRGNAPQMKLVTVSYVPAGSNPINLVGRNQVDFLAMPPGSVTSEEVGALNLDLKEETTFRTVYLGLDLSLNPDNPLVDPRVREALGLGLDRADMAALLAQELDATTSVVPARPGEAPAVARFDYTAARKLLRDAGYEAGFTLDLFYSDAETDRYPGLLNALDKIALDLGNLGVQVRLRRTPEGIYETRRRDGTLRSLLEPTPPVGVAHFMPGFVLTLRPTAEPTPPPQPPAAVSYVGVLEDSLGQMRDADVLLEAPGAARTLFTRARFLATMPVSVAELGPLYGKFVAQEAEKNHLVLPLAVEARSVAVLAHSSVSGLKFTGDTAVLSLKDVTVNR
jgi:peptide/nickel transport system substrate-binding protein